MRIQVISFKSSLESNSVRDISEIINASDAELIVFSGAVNLRCSDITKLRSRITNRKPVAFLDARGRDRYNSLYMLRDGKIKSLESKQMFSTSDDLKKDSSLAGEYIDELAKKRVVRVHGHKVMLMVCGENNIVVSRNPRTPEHFSEFRSKDSSLESRFEGLIGKADIIVNPTHLINSRPWLYHERAEYFSANGRIYVMAANGNDFSSPNIQYVYRDGQLQKPLCSSSSDSFLSTYYEV